MLTATGFLEGDEQAQIYNIAPGKRSVPLSIFRDKYSEELTYPGIFLGQKSPENDDRLVDVHECPLMSLIFLLNKIEKHQRLEVLK